jgi:hypothetical protein
MRGTEWGDLRARGVAKEIAGYVYKWYVPCLDGFFQYLVGHVLECADDAGEPMDTNPKHLERTVMKGIVKTVGAWVGELTSMTMDAIFAQQQEKFNDVAEIIEEIRGKTFDIDFTQIEVYRQYDQWAQSRGNPSLKPSGFRARGGFSGVGDVELMRFWSSDAEETDECAVGFAELMTKFTHDVGDELRIARGDRVLTVQL